MRQPILVAHVHRRPHDHRLHARYEPAVLVLDLGTPLHRQRLPFLDVREPHDRVAERAAAPRDRRIRHAGAARLLIDGGRDDAVRRRVAVDLDGPFDRPDGGERHRLVRDARQLDGACRRAACRPGLRATGAGIVRAGGGAKEDKWYDQGASGNLLCTSSSQNGSARMVHEKYQLRV